MMTAMSAHFVRVSVVSGESRLDVSLPAQRPVAEFLTDITELLEIEPVHPAPEWALSGSRHGVLELEATLAEAGVLDGTVLHLTPRESAARTPYVDDVIDAVESSIDHDCEQFAGAARDRVVGAIVSAALVASAALIAACGAGVPGTLALLALAVLVVLIAGAVGSRAHGRIEWALPPVLAAAAVSALPTRPAVAVLAGLAAALVGLAGLAARRGRTGILFGTAASAVGFGLAAGAVAAGANVTALSAWVAPALVLVLVVTPRAATATSGLLGLVRRGESGDAVSRTAVDAATLRGRDLLDVLVVVTALASSLAVGTLMWTGMWMQAALGGLVGLTLLLRSRAFTGVRHVAPLLLVPVVAALGAGACLARMRFGDDPVPQALVLTVGGLVIALVIAFAGYVRLGEVAAARLARTWDLLDPVLLFVLLPATFAAQGIYAYIHG